MSRVAGLLIAVALLGACSTRDSDAAAAAEVAVHFYDAFTTQDGASACDALAPETAHEVEKSAKAPCATALLDEELPEAGTVTGSEVYGNEARVALAGDTVFLSDFNGIWKVTAAGCSERPELPHDCQIGG